MESPNLGDGAVPQELAAAEPPEVVAGPDDPTPRKRGGASAFLEAPKVKTLSGRYHAFLSHSLGNWGQFEADFGERSEALRALLKGLTAALRDWSILGGIFFTERSASRWASGAGGARVHLLDRIENVRYGQLRVLRDAGRWFQVLRGLPAVRILRS